MLKAIPFNEPILLILKNNISYSEKKKKRKRLRFDFIITN